MDYDNAGGVVSGGCDDCGHNSCDFDVILSHNFEERYKINLLIIVIYTHVYLVYYADHLTIPLTMH